MPPGNIRARTFASCLFASMKHDLKAMHTKTVDIEFALRIGEKNTVLADAILQPPESNSDTVIARNVPVALDPTALLVYALDPLAYGDQLSEMFFASPALRGAWIRATTYQAATGFPLRVRLRIDPDATVLHTLRWETLRDPDSKLPLCFSRRILVSRYLDASDPGRVPVIGRADLRAVVCVANPTDIDKFGLTPVDTDGEVNRTRLALAGIELAVLARGFEGVTASLTALTDLLERGYPILYLVCHGALREGEAILYLEDSGGRCTPEMGSRLVRAIADLPADRRPLLIVLAVCRSAGNGAEDIAGALGPQLARAGVAAVVGMQGDIPIATVERLLPRFFTALAEDGTIDRALSLARAGLLDDDPWWMPALYLRARDGRIWNPGTERSDSQTATSSLSALSDLVAQRTELRAIIAGYRADFEATRSQVGIVADYKLLHDLFQQLEGVVVLLRPAARRLPDDDRAWEELEVNEPEARRLIGELLRVAGQVSFADEASLWARRLERIRGELRLAVTESDHASLQRALGQLDQLLSRELTRVNGGLVAAARALRLQALVQALAEVQARSTLITVPADLRDLLANVVSGVDALERLAKQLSVLVRIHDLFQELDNELRVARPQIEREPEVLDDVWADLEPLVGRLTALDGHWRDSLAEGVRALKQGFSSGAPSAMRRAFVRFTIQANHSFNETDHTLLTLCNELKILGLPLQAIVTRLE